MRFWSGDTIKSLKPEHVFVFGSNPQGRHGAGAAKAALAFGAKYGIGRGLQGQSYALVTKNLKAGFKEPGTGIVYETEGFQSVNKTQIEHNILELFEIAEKNPDKYFIVSYKYETWPNGSPKKSLNGYSGEEMWEMFTNNKVVPANMVFHNSFKALMVQQDSPKAGPKAP